MGWQDEVDASRDFMRQPPCPENRPCNRLKATEGRLDEVRDQLRAARLEITHLNMALARAKEMILREDLGEGASRDFVNLLHQELDDIALGKQR